MLNFLCEEAATTNNGMTRVVMTGFLIIVLVGMLVLPYISSRKKNREYEAMISSLKVGDLVKTAGGIIGRITKIMNKGEINTVILETGSKTEKSYMEFDINMIYCILKAAKVEGEQTELEEVEEDEDEDETEDSAEENAETENVAEPVAEEMTETTEEPATEEKMTEEKPAEKTYKTKTAVVKKTTKKSNKKK